ncbi:tRNA (adenosine(37)-N6)-threonylcarbamoyltransferase complex ATPase subunit type 1 TsaE [Neorhodopirellula lusitana]|uniref:tRNA (adenosine(37)-N6)-threonylcarbamoyltransferase complex ATPase subunit type 1 TsaE n=1 Tax=Neorhodopirellula lusitana TaxID=445327 RepID=UPI00384AF5AE
MNLTQVDLVALKILTDTLVNNPCRSSLVVGLVGTLGAGKTRLCQELGRSLGMQSSEITSPTFTLIRTYELTDRTAESQSAIPTTSTSSGMTPRRWHHLDVYRVTDEDEWWELGIEELWDQDRTWTILEWADRFESLMPNDALWIEIMSGPSDNPDEREIVFRCSDRQIAEWLGGVQQEFNSRQLAR